MPNKLPRREFIQQATILTLGSLLPTQLLAQTANPFVSNFNDESTAEEVTEGIDLSGKIAVVTGGNSGLGFETARVLAKRGAHVYVSARTQEKAEKACAQMEGKTTPIVMELTDFDSIVNCTNTIKQSTDTIDMLICNAGIMQPPELELFNGVEKQFAVNHLGHFLFATHLIEPVKAAEQGRVVMLSSLAYQWAPETGIDFDNLDGSQGYDPSQFYGQSKAANHLFALSLSERFAGTHATANSIHPGVINTNLGRDFSLWMRIAAKLIGWTFMKSIPEGAATTCYVATEPQLATVSGHYFEDCNPITPELAYMTDKALAEKLWQVSAKLCGNYYQA